MSELGETDTTVAITPQLVSPEEALFGESVKVARDFGKFIEPHESKTGKKTTRLSEEGRQEIKTQIRDQGFIDNLGYVNEEEVRGWIQDLKGTYEDTNSKNRTDEQKFNYLTVRSLEMRLQRARTIDVEESIKVSNSPWKEVAEKIGQLPEYQAKFKSELSSQAFIQQMLVPVGQAVYEEVQNISSDPLDRDLIFYTFADRLARDIDVDQLSQKQEQWKDKPDKFKRLATVAMGGELTSEMIPEMIEEQFSRTIRTLLLKTRVESEQPEFVLESMQAKLSKMEEKDKKGLLPEKNRMDLNSLRTEVKESVRVRERIVEQAAKVENEEQLTDALQEVWKEMGLGREEIVGYLLEETWLPGETREVLEEEKGSLKIGEVKEGVIGKVLKGLSSIEKRLKSIRSMWVLNSTGNLSICEKPAMIKGP